jgi:hypothetical protein
LLFRKKRRRKRPLEDAHSYLSPRRAFVLVYVVAEDVAVAVDFEEGEEDEEKREEEEEARTLVSMWISKGEGAIFSRQNNKNERGRPVPCFFNTKTAKEKLVIIPAFSSLHMSLSLPRAVKNSLNRQNEHFSDTLVLIGAKVWSTRWRRVR